ncbi:MAG: hypothetical protein WC717_04370 [Candidatus Micrarchaeia archaeon]|jgi:hypothetical protein
MESDFLKLNVFNARSSSDYFKALQDFSAKNPDAKSQAFCMQAAISLSIWSERMAAALFATRDKASASAFLSISQSSRQMYSRIAATPGITPYLDHYQNLFAVAEASRRETGELSLSEAPLRKLAGIMDAAQASQQSAGKGTGTLEGERHYFVFASKANADEFVANVLGSASLPVEFDASVGTAADKLGADYVQRKSISSGAYVVEFTCAYTGVSSAQASKPKTAISVKSAADKRSSITWKYSSQQKEVSEADIVQYANGEMKLAGSGKGDMSLYGLAELWYGKGYKIDPVKDAAAAKEITTGAFRELMAKYGISLQEPLDAFLASEGGQAFIKQLNATAPRVNGSASIEVFYDGSNYAALSAAVKENWKLATERAKLISDYVNKVNATLVKGGLAPIDMQTSPSLYFFQDLPADVVDRLVADAKLPPDLRAWLSANKGNLKGKEHMDALVSYLESNQGQDGGTAYGKVSKAYAANDYALMNRLWQRTERNKEGLRAEARDSQSLLVDAIEDSGDGSSRSASISTSVQAKFGIEMAEIGEQKTGSNGRADVEVPIMATSSVKGVSPCINAYLVSGEAATPLKDVNDKGEYVIRDLSPGEYSIVAYAQSDDGKVKTTLVGQKFKVTAKEKIINNPQTDGIYVPGRQNEYNSIPFYAVNKVEEGEKKYSEKVDVRVAFVAIGDGYKSLGILSPGKNRIQKATCYSVDGKDIAITSDISLNGVSYTKEDLLEKLHGKAVGIMVGDSVYALDGYTKLAMDENWTVKNGIVSAPSIEQSTRKVVVHEGANEPGEPVPFPGEYLIPPYAFLPESNVLIGSETFSPKKIAQLAKQGYIALIRDEAEGEEASVYDLNGNRLGLLPDINSEAPVLKGIYSYVPKEMQVSLKKLPKEAKKDKDKDPQYWFNHPTKVYGPSDAKQIHGEIKAVASYREEEAK